MNGSTGDPKETESGGKKIYYSSRFEKIISLDDFLDKIAIPYVRFIEDQRDEGIIQAPDGAIDMLHVQTLQVDIRNGSYHDLQSDPKTCLETGVKNVNPDFSGKAPIKWLSDTTTTILKNRNSI